LPWAIKFASQSAPLSSGERLTSLAVCNANRRPGFRKGPNFGAAAWVRACPMADGRRHRRRPFAKASHARARCDAQIARSPFLPRIGRKKTHISTQADLLEMGDGLARAVRLLLQRNAIDRINRRWQRSNRAAGSAIGAGTVMRNRFEIGLHIGDCTAQSDNSGRRFD